MRSVSFIVLSDKKIRKVGLTARKEGNTVIARAIQ
jgi:hypothetical protein